MAGVWYMLVPQMTEYTNLCTNPSFEINTTGWTAVVASVTADIGVGTHGNKGLTVTTTTASADGVYYGSVALTVGTTYTAGIDIKGTTAKEYLLYFADTSGNTMGSATTITIASSSYWQREYVSLACATSDNYRLYVRKNNWDEVDTFYVDAVSIIATTAELTYFDGDTANCRWTGVVHGSKSVCSAQARNVGIVTDLLDYNLRVLQMDGVGTAQSSHQVSEYALMPGAEYKGHKVQPRYITLTSAAYGTSLENLHSKRKDIVDLFKHDLTADDQPIVLRYVGANSSRPIDITCYLDQEIGSFDNQKHQMFAIRLACYDPYFYDIYESALAIDDQDSATLNYFACKRNGVWTNITPSSASAGAASPDVKSIAVVNKFTGLGSRFNGEYIYVGGEFVDWDGTAASDYITYYDPEKATWNAVEAGTNGSVICLATGPEGNLYAGGGFTQIGATAGVNGFAYWTGVQWIGTGIFTLDVLSIVIGNDGIVYAGHADPTGNGSADEAYISKFNGSSWSALATGLDSPVYALCKDNAGNIYAGGAITGGVSRWNGSAFTSLSCPFACYALAADASGRIYAGGTSGEYVMMWNGQSWVSLGGGITTGTRVWSIDIDSNGLVWVGGNFTVVGGLAVRGLACWNGFSWIYPPINLPSSTVVQVVRCNGNDVYLGFDTTGTVEYAGQTTVANNGTSRVYPVIQFSSTADTADIRYIENVSTGKKIYLNYTLLAGEKMYINLAENNRSAVSSYFGNVWRSIIRGSEFGDFYLLPGNNTLSMFSGSTDLDCYMKFTTRHESIDGGAA